MLHFRLSKHTLTPHIFSVGQDHQRPGSTLLSPHVSIYGRNTHTHLWYMNFTKFGT